MINNNVKAHIERFATKINLREIKNEFRNVGDEI